MSTVGKKILRKTKNNLGGYSDIQIKIRKATSNENKCANNLLLNDIALASWNEQQFLDIMEILEKRLNDKGKNWRHVYKSLTLLEYLLYHGSEMVVKYIKNNIYVIKTLKDFQYIDENGQDEGINVRVKSKEIFDLISNESKLLSERSRLKTRKSKPSSSSRPKNLNDYDEDLEIKKAIENSKETLVQDEKRREIRRNHENSSSIEKNNREKGKAKISGKEKNKEKDLLILDEPIPNEIQPNENNLPYEQLQYLRMQQQFQGMDFFGNNNNNNSELLMSQNLNNMQLGQGNMMNNNIDDNNSLLIGNANFAGNTNLLMGNGNLMGNNMLISSNNNNFT